MPVFAVDLAGPPDLASETDILECINRNGTPYALSDSIRYQEQIIFNPTYTGTVLLYSIVSTFCVAKLTTVMQG